MNDAYTVEMEKSKAAKLAVTGLLLSGDEYRRAISLIRSHITGLEVKRITAPGVEHWKVEISHYTNALEKLRDQLKLAQRYRVAD